jgi:hypothetical protein
MSYSDPLGKLLTEIRDHSSVSAITDRIRGEEMAQGDKPPLVIIRSFPTTRLINAPRVPLLRHGFAILCYGTTPKQATQLALAVAEAVQTLEPRVSNSGVAVYQSFHGTINPVETDPDTQWPFRTLFPSAIASTMSVTA